MAYVGGDNRRPHNVAALPAGCNFFDGATTCLEDNYGPFEVYLSDGTLLTSTGYACTTAHGEAPFDTDPYDEFGLHLIDGLETSA